MGTATGELGLIAPGSQVVVRDEEWLVRSVQETPADGLMVKLIGVSEQVLRSRLRRLYHSATSPQGLRRRLRRPPNERPARVPGS
jgi:hypothetical protein